MLRLLNTIKRKLKNEFSYVYTIGVCSLVPSNVSLCDSSTASWASAEEVLEAIKPYEGLPSDFYLKMVGKYAQELQEKDKE